MRYSLFIVFALIVHTLAQDEIINNNHAKPKPKYVKKYTVLEYFHGLLSRYERTIQKFEDEGKDCVAFELKRQVPLIRTETRQYEMNKLRDKTITQEGFERMKRWFKQYEDKLERAIHLYD